MKKFDITQFKPFIQRREYFNSKASFEEAWNDCQRGDWMLWTAAELKINDRLLIKAKALCTNTVRHLMEDNRSTDAIDAALLYADGKISREELRRHDSCGAYCDAYYNCSNNITRIALCAAAAADLVFNYNDHDYDAFSFYTASYTAAYAAYAAAYFSAAIHAPYISYVFVIPCKKNQQQTADICRKILTEAVFEKINKLKSE